MAQKRKKGFGFFGELPALGKHKGMRSTEVSIGVGRKSKQIPSLTPNLSKKQVKKVLRGEMSDKIVAKAIIHAKQRGQQGKSVFAKGGRDRIEARRRGASLGLVINPRARRRKKKKK